MPKIKKFNIDTGTSVDQLIVLEDVGGGTPGLPAVDGSQLTGIVGTGEGGVSDHGALDGLDDPDHPIGAVQGLQTALDGKAAAGHSHDASYVPLSRTVATQHSLVGGGALSSNRTLSLVGDAASPGANKVYGTDGAGARGWKNDPAGGGGGVTDHGALTGLADDDHAQYHTDARGDARYTALAHASATNNPHAVTKAQVGLSNVPDLKVNLAAGTAPTSTNDSSAGYSTGSRWIDDSAGREWVCVEATVGAAVWVETTTQPGTAVAVGPNGAVQYNASGVVAGESPMVYDEGNNLLLVDQEIRDATYPFASANIGGSNVLVPFNYKQICRLTVTSNVTAALALPTQVKEVSSSPVGAATSYFVLRQLIIRQDGTNIRSFPATFWDNYSLRGAVAPLPSTATGKQEYLLIGEWNGSAWTWEVLGDNAAFRPLIISTTPVTLTKTTTEVLLISGAGTVNLPAANGDGQEIFIVNRSGATRTVAPNGADTINGGVTTIATGDAILLIDYPVGSDEWTRI